MDAMLDDDARDLLHDDKVRDSVTPDNSILTDAALAGIALLTVATFGVVWRMRDDVRDLTRTVADPRNGLTVAVDKLTVAVDGIGDRVLSLEDWREAQGDGDGA